MARGDVSSLAAEPVAIYGRLERAAFVLAAIVMLAIVGASVVIAGRTNADLSEAAQAQVIRVLTVDLLKAVMHAETGQRGYLLTGKVRYLGPYRQAVEAAPGIKQELLRRLPGDPDLARWLPVVDAKMAELAETIRLDKAGQREAAMALVQSDRGQDAMDRINSLEWVLAKRQRRTIVNNLARSQTGAQLLVAVDAFAFLVLGGLTLFVAHRAHRTFGDLNAAQASLREANAALEAGSERLEQAVMERTADLVEANTEIQRFAYIVSHDLRAPLLNIIGFTSELEVATSKLNGFVRVHHAGAGLPQDVREASEEDLPEAIRFIQASTAKMDRLITAILKLSREGRRVLMPERLDVAAILGGILDTLRHQIELAGADVAIEGLPPVVTDRVALEQVLSNLVENALKYGYPGRAIRIRVTGEQLGPLVRYTVTDNGRGIQPRDLERVFELFRRAGNQDQPGEGIGLAHVRALARRLGGTVTCVSTLGEGSSFMLVLPAESMLTATRGDREPRGNAPPGGDDEPSGDL